MKTQISRDSFQPGQRYTGIHQQQGRMLTDADWNELMAICREQLLRALAEVVGSGSPRLGAVAVLPDRRLQPGGLYVDGVRAELPGSAPLAASAQPDLPGYPALPAAGPYLVYADVWDRAVTSLEDPALRDPGLHGADTCTRTQTMLQVKTCPATVDPETELPRQGNAALSLALHASLEAGDPCDPCAGLLAAGQGRVGSYLFRLEVHAVDGPAANPSRLALKWSSENGAEQYQALAVEQMPPGFVAPRHVYEFHDLTTEKHLGLFPGPGFTPTRGVIQSVYELPAAPPRAWVRRWDGFCELTRTGAAWTLAGGADRGVPLTTSGPPAAPGRVTLGAALRINLEALQLTLELTGRSFLAGDFWLAPVREAVLEPGDPVLAGAAPQGPVHRYLRLARVQADGTVEPFADEPDRRRRRFPPLTDLRAHDVGYRATCASGLFDAGHDNVEKALNRLCQLAAQHVTYSATCNQGLFAGFSGTVKQALDQICTLEAGQVGFVKPCDTGVYQGQTVTTVEQALKLLCTPRADQISVQAKPECALLHQPGIQTVQDAIEALCARPTGRGCRVTVGPGGDFERLDEAVRNLVGQGGREICLCLLPGDHELSGFKLESPEVRLSLSGCGAAACRVLLREAPLELTAHSLALTGIRVQGDSPAATLVLQGRSVILEGNHLIGSTEQQPWLTLGASEELQLVGNRIEVFPPKARERLEAVLVPWSEAADLFALAGRDEFLTRAGEAAVELAARSFATRTRRVRDLRESVARQDAVLSPREKEDFERLAGLLADRQVSAEEVALALDRIREATATAQPALAVSILNARAETLLDRNQLTGLLSFYGAPAEAAPPSDQFEEWRELLGKLEFSGTGRNLQLRNNRLTGVTVGQKMVKTLEAVREQGGGRLNGLFDTALLTDNVLARHDNHFLARKHSLTATRFEGRDGDAGVVLGENAVYLGNFAPNDFRLFSLTHWASEAATLGLNIIR